MLFGQNRETLRRFYYDVWRKHEAGQPLEPMETLVAEVIIGHPEYHPVLMAEEQHLDRDYLPELGEGNPFLHMGMHIALKEQVATDRPSGLRDCYRQLLRKVGDPHEAEHRMMECLGQVLWQAQHAGGVPDEADYLTCIQGLCPG